MGKLKEKVYKKIKECMDELQESMETNRHLYDKEGTVALINTISLYWQHLSDEDRDYVHAAQYAIEENSEWKP